MHFVILEDPSIEVLDFIIEERDLGGALLTKWQYETHFKYSLTLAFVTFH